MYDDLNFRGVLLVFKLVCGFLCSLFLVSFCLLACASCGDADIDGAASESDIKQMEINYVNVEIHEEASVIQVGVYDNDLGQKYRVTYSLTDGFVLFFGEDQILSGSSYDFSGGEPDIIVRAIDGSVEDRIYELRITQFSAPEFQPLSPDFITWEWEGSTERDYLFENKGDSYEGRLTATISSNFDFVFYASFIGELNSGKENAEKYLAIRSATGDSLIVFPNHDNVFSLVIDEEGKRLSFSVNSDVLIKDDYILPNDVNFRFELRSLAFDRGSKSGSASSSSRLTFQSPVMTIESK